MKAGNQQGGVGEVALRPISMATSGGRLKQGTRFRWEAAFWLCLAVFGFHFKYKS